MSTAFFGSEQVRQTVIGRLDEMAAAGALKPSFIEWDGKEGSVVGAILSGTDLDAWETQVGLPKCYAYLIDYVASAQPDLATSTRVVHDILGAVAPGADAQALSNRMLAALIENVRARIDVLRAPAPLLASTDEIALLQQQAANGHDVPPAQWRAARKKVSALVGKLDEPVFNAAAEAIESAAWNPRTSPTGLNDAFRAWQALDQTLEPGHTVWTEAENQRMQTRLEGIAEQYYKPGDAKTVYEWLEELYPQEADALKANLALENENYDATARRMTAMVVGTLKSVGGN